MKHFTSIISLFAVMIPVAVFAQTTMQGTETNMSNNASVPFTYVRSFINTDTVVYTDYNMYTGKGLQFGQVTVSFHKKSKKVKVVMERDIGTEPVKDEYQLTYNDTLGLIFGLEGPIRKEPTIKIDLLLKWSDANRKNLLVFQIIDKGIPVGFEEPERIGYTFDKLTPAMLQNNDQFYINTFGTINISPKNKNIQQNQLPDNTTVTTTTTTGTQTQSNSSGITNVKSNVKEFKADSLQVILKPTMNEVVSVRLFMKGGVTNYLASKEGIESVALDMAVTGGTKNYPGILFQQIQDDLGISIQYQLAYDYSEISMECLKQNFASAWSVFTEVLLAPIMSQDAFSNAKQKFINDAQNRISDTEELLREAAYDNLFPAKYYDKNPNGSEITLTKLSYEEVKKYYSSLISKRKCFLVVAGNFTQDEFAKSVSGTLRGMPAGSYVAANLSSPEITTSSLKIFDGSGSNIITGMCTAPAMKSNDAVAYSLLLQLLKVRLNQSLAEKGLTSGIHIQVTRTLQNLSMIQFTATDPDKTVQAIVDEIRRAKKSGFTADELQSTRDRFLIDNFLNNEGNADQTFLLGEAEIFGDYVLAENFNSQLNTVTLTEVNSIMKKYFKAIRFFYSGNRAAVNPIIFEQKIE